MKIFVVIPCCTLALLFIERKDISRSYISNISLSHGFLKGKEVPFEKDEVVIYLAIF